MARKPRTDTKKNSSRNGIGGNREPLTEDEQGALTLYYALKVIEDQRKLAAAKVVLEFAPGRAHEDREFGLRPPGKKEIPRKPSYMPITPLARTRERGRG